MKGDSIGGPIRCRMHVPVTPEFVYAALDSDAGRAAFWAESAPVRDGHVHFRFHDGTECARRVLERRPPRSWAIDDFGTPARFELAPDGAGRTDLLLTHEGVAPRDWNEVHAGWLDVLFPLEAWLAHGVDLRNHDPRRAWDQGYSDS